MIHPDDRALADELSAIAADLTSRGYPNVGSLRRAARRVLGLDAPDSLCEGCGQPLDQPPTGRRRTWCSEACRSRARRRRDRPGTDRGRDAA